MSTMKNMMAMFYVAVMMMGDTADAKQDNFDLEEMWNEYQDYLDTGYYPYMGRKLNPFVLIEIQNKIEWREAILDPFGIFKLIDLLVGYRPIYPEIMEFFNIDWPGKKYFRSKNRPKPGLTPVRARQGIPTVPVKPVERKF